MPIGNTLMRNNFGTFVALLIAASILLLSGCERSEESAKRSAKATPKVGSVEWKQKMERDNYCKSNYEEFSEDALQALYKFDGNLPKISDSKIKRLQFVKNEWGDHKNSKAYRHKLFDEEMYPDPDYWQWKIQVETKKLISRIEGTLKWPQDRDALLSYLFHTRVKTSSDFELPYAYGNTQRRIELNQFYDKVDLLNEAARWSFELDHFEAQLSRLGEGDRLDKALSAAEEIARKARIVELSFRVPSAMQGIIRCQIEFLSKF
jgi:hypothetical protein